MLKKFDKQIEIYFNQKKKKKKKNFFFKVQPLFVELQTPPRGSQCLPKATTRSLPFPKATNPTHGLTPEAYHPGCTRRLPPEDYLLKATT